jgi:amino acid transporter
MQLSFYISENSILTQKQGGTSLEKGKLRRELSLVDLTLLGVGSIIGSGWLFAAWKATKVAGPAAIWSWVIATVAVLIIALVYAELGGMLPRSGGIIRYPQYSHGSLVGYMQSFAGMLGFSTVISIEAEGTLRYASSWIPGLYVANQGPTFLGWLVQAVLLFLFFYLNFHGVKLFAKTNTIITFIKMIVPTITLIMLIASLKGGNFTAAGGFAPHGFPAVLEAVSSAGVVFSLLGFRQAVDFASEAKNPQRDVPLAVIFSLLIAATIYILLQIGYIGSMPANLLQHGWANITFKSPYADLAVALGMGWLAMLLYADAVISPFGTGNVFMGSTSRFVYGFARNGYWFSAFRVINNRVGVPRPALWFTFILALFWTLPFPTWEKLVDVSSDAQLLTFLVGPVTALALRKSLPDAHRPFRLKGMKLFALLAFVVSALMIYWAGWHTTWILMSLQLFSLTLFAAFVDASPSLRPNIKTHLRAGAWLIGFYVLELIISYLGTFGGKGILPYPLDNILIIVGAVVFFYWGLNSALEIPMIDSDPVEGITEDEDISTISASGMATKL